MVPPDGFSSARNNKDPAPFLPSLRILALYSKFLTFVSDIAKLSPVPEE